MDWLPSESVEATLNQRGAVAPTRSSRGFWALIVTQFQGAFSDNILRNLLLSMIVGMNLAKTERETFVSVVTFLFSVPFLIFSMPGGWLADRFSKRQITIWTKVMEFGSMLLATAGLATHTLSLSLVALTLVASQAALFGPSKYGLLPELLPEKRLSWGNGVIELGTFLAIIVGTVAGAWMGEHFASHEMYAGYVLLGLSVVGFITSLSIDKVQAAAPEKRLRLNIVGDLWAQIGKMRANRALFLAVLGNTYFWFLGSLLFSTIVIYGPDVLHIGQTKTGYLNAMLAVGIGLGSMAAGWISDNKIEYGLIPLGSIGMTCTGFALGVRPHGVMGSALLLGMLGFWAGLFAVPVNALIQHKPAEQDKGGIIAAANLLSFVGIALSSGVYFIFTAWVHLDPRGVIVAASCITAISTAYVLCLLPEWFGRLILFFATRTLYRVRVLGRDNFPEKTGALLVCNHMSFVDAALLVAATDRPIRFVMYQGIYDHPLVKPFARMLKAIPISSEQHPREMLRSLRTATDALRNHEIVCIFAEGQITRTGQLLPFRRGLERIMKDVNVPIIPVNLDGVWGSVFSFERGRFLWKMPRRIPYRVTVSFGEPMAPVSSAVEVRTAVQELQVAAFETRKSSMKTLDQAFISTARQRPRRFFMADGKTPRVSFGSALNKTVYIARRLRQLIGEQRMVGVLLPPSVGGSLTNYALMLMGRVPVNLNYTSSNETIAACAAQCGLDRVITSKAFVERFPNLAIPGRTVLLEDALAEPRFSEKLCALAMAWLMPTALLKRALGARRPKDEASTMDSLATVIFSSGSTGEPKGVMLSHFNIVANIRQVSQVFMLGGQDKILGILPFFHSFGVTAGPWLPAVQGVGVVFHPNPLDAQVIGGLVEKYKVTFLVATPTFLQAYMRRCTPEQFGSLQYVLAGAEKLPERVAVAFEDQFGIRPLEGYGCTECSPVVTVNGRDYRAPGFRQVAAKRGKIGHPLPGVSVKVVDLEMGLPVPAGKSGMLLVKGPNVMQGYLGRPEKTAEVLHDGWYTTGDVAMLEEDGFITITDRLSRFSKIGGEMVPHIRIEEKLHELADVTKQVFAVTAVPDEKKGERIVVLHTLPETKLAVVLERLAQCDLPALWRPKTNQFVQVQSIPTLGTGKMDLRAIRALAVSAAETEVQTCA
ncbi:MAG TPA: acyl-[ACP]--phospholipid O-acyltransferase [Acidobacteriaceae bacterium]|jgi:acyl-[acyl-carrier-protein]-phospholipid O-acyltransferase/long-chain-fatty-acid--[acyl-carrier-protein] ligase|nr:acyl-[ACP]--phospholipid O-acyltransferase [Acidobacteriaceae bacterium]